MKFRAVLMMCLITACGGDDVGPDGEDVGGPCAGSGDCSSDSQCHQSGAFPGGVCVLPCSSAADCPDGASCISKEGGICVQACNAASECRSGYDCTETTAKAGGTTRVCIVG